MPLALFDLDYTLVCADTPSLWFDYLLENGHIPEAGLKETIKRYAEDYRLGQLDFDAYMQFELMPMASNRIEDLLIWRERYQIRCIRPNISKQARQLIKKHKTAGDTTIIITASNGFVAEASKIELEVDELIATDAEFINGRFTGHYKGIACFQTGKIDKINDWTFENGRDLKNSWFYSDSINDLPLLETVSHPFAVNADPQLTRIARQRNWPLLDLCSQPP